MELFFDTSAVVPLLLDEPFSKKACLAWERANRVWGWRWLQVEAEAALCRRKAPATAWRQWAQLSAGFNWLDLETKSFPLLRAFNRPLRLRAADAGHLYTLQLATQVIPSMKLVCFDKELKRAAKLLGLDLAS